MVLSEKWIPIIFPLQKEVSLNKITVSEYMTKWTVGTQTENKVDFDVETSFKKNWFYYFRFYCIKLVPSDLLLCP